ncbi:sensor histidine kinase [Pedobacter heparinus]|uniref:sensor histidine kinase n=1 Tax=Pedobacter heparinus TaxID=984 RepID=UPI00292E4032|nr:histidine kinase [Pedobacter heparinus]
MKISLLTFLTGCLYSLNSIAQPNVVIDTAHIRPAKISVFDDNWLLTNKPKRTFLDPYLALFREKEFNIKLFSDVKVDITNIAKNAHYRLYLKNLSDESYVLISDRWTYNHCDSSASILIDRKLFNRPFRYEVSVIPMAKLDGKTFTILSNKVTDKSVFGKKRAYFNADELYRVRKNFIWLHAFLAYMGIAFYLTIRFRAINATKQKEKAQLQLDAVRSQLNPHFLFNALAGIQNLMNTNQSEQANRYLTRFARLTRAVLKSNDLISLEEECNLLDDYLQMEQLRFNFKYEITTDPNLDLYNTEIPSMLLQPFIENAVKHGIANLNSDGQINIAIFKTYSDLILKIEDNGKGFDASKSYEGLGFDLSTKRIALLNKIYKKDPIRLSMESKPGKTTVTITLTKWL